MSHGELIEQCVGKFKRWQLFICLVVFLANIPLVWQELSIIFLAPPQQFQCIDNTIDKCSANCSSHVFNTSVFTNTIVSEWDLVCQREWLASFAQTVLMFGVLVGNVGFGFASDKYGRRLPMVCAAMIQVFAGVSVAFAPWFWLFMVLRFLVAVATGGTLCTAFVITIEIVGRQYRSTLGILFSVTYYIGHTLLAAFGYFIRDWRRLQIGISLPSVFLISYYWILPESPRWLLTVKREEKAIAVMERGAKINRMPIEPIRGLVMAEMENEEPPEEGIVGLFRNRNVRIKTLCIWFNWVVLGLTYFGVAQYMGKIPGDIFMNVAICGLIEIPGNFIIIFVVNRWGRKITIIITYLMSGCACLLISVIGNTSEWQITLFGAIGLLGISLSFATMFVFSGELYPTVVRNIGMGTSAMFAKFGSMTAPFIAELSERYFWLPPIVFGVGPLLGLLVCLKLPETLDSKMPDTISEAELFGKEETAR